MEQDGTVALSPRRRQGLLRDQVQLIKVKDSERYEIVPIEDSFSFGKGLFAVIRACQLLSQKNEGLILVGLAGPSGAGKSFFTEKILNFMPSIAIINMDNYSDGTFFDGPRLTDYETLLDNIRGLKDGKSVQVPVYDFKSSSRNGYRTLEVPSSRIVILEGISALSEKLRPLLDLRVSVTGGLHFDLVKQVFCDIQCAGEEPEEIIHQISETVYPMYKALVESDLKTAHIKIQNMFNLFSGPQNPTYILKSTKAVTPEQMKAVLSEDFTERTEETYDIYLLPPDQDRGACQSYLRIRNQDGKYNLMFEEWVTASPFIISPRITFEVSGRLVKGLMGLGYTIETILKRKSHIFDDDKVIVKTDWLEQLKRTYVQVQGRDRSFVENVANQLGLEGSYVPRTYIEQIQLEGLVNDVMILPDDLKKFSRPQEALPRAYADCRVLDARPPATLPNQGVMTQILDQISTLNERMGDITSHIEELNYKMGNRIAASGSQQHTLALPMVNDNGSSSSSQFVRESPWMEEVARLAREQRIVMIQLGILSKLVQEYVGERSRIERLDSNSTNSTSTVPVLIALAIGCLGILAFSSLR